jgi:copper chaperone
MEYNFQVENIRCGGCANTITKKLREINGVNDVYVNVEDKQVIVTTESATDDEVHQILSEKLFKLGYPEVGTIGSNNLKAKATSVVSCAIGKVSSKS